jgi:hypothetical protein
MSGIVGVLVQVVVLGMVLFMAVLIGVFLIAGILDIADDLRVILS